MCVPARKSFSFSLYFLLSVFGFRYRMGLCDDGSEVHIWGFVYRSILIRRPALPCLAGDEIREGLPQRGVSSVERRNHNLGR
jgi:hypothetical protein